MKDIKLYILTLVYTILLCVSYAKINTLDKQILAIDTKIYTMDRQLDQTVKQSAYDSVLEQIEAYNKNVDKLQADVGDWNKLWHQLFDSEQEKYMKTHK